MPNMVEIVVEDDASATIATLAPRMKRDQVGSFEDVTSADKADRAKVTLSTRTQGNGVYRSVFKIVQPVEVDPINGVYDDIIAEVTIRSPELATSDDISAVREMIRGALKHNTIISLTDDREGIF